VPAAAGGELLEYVAELRPLVETAGWCGAPAEVAAVSTDSRPAWPRWSWAEQQAEGVGVGDEAWLVTGYEQVRSLLDDDRIGRSHPDPAHAARTGESVLFGGPLGDFETEHADHARMRSLLQPHFSPKRMRPLRPRIEALTSDVLDELAGPGAVR
jgi:cytochrome P450